MTQANWISPPRAKPHAIRTLVAQQVHGAQVQDNFEIAGNTYTMRTLWPYEEAWADSKVAGTNFYQAGRNRRAPYVAASIVAINNVSVRELYQLPDEAPSELKTAYTNDEKLYDEWRRDQAYLDIMSPDAIISPPVLAQLWMGYQVLEERRDAALEKIGPLSKRTEATGSSPTSSPEKASS